MSYYVLSLLLILSIGTTTVKNPGTEKFVLAGLQSKWCSHYALGLELSVAIKL